MQLRTARHRAEREAREKDEAQSKVDRYRQTYGASSKGRRSVRNPKLKIQSHRQLLDGIVSDRSMHVRQSHQRLRDLAVAQKNELSSKKAAQVSEDQALPYLHISHNCIRSTKL